MTLICIIGKIQKLSRNAKPQTHLANEIDRRAKQTQCKFQCKLGNNAKITEHCCVEIL